MFFFVVSLRTNMAFYISVKNRAHRACFHKWTLEGWPESPSSKCFLRVFYYNSAVYGLEQQLEAHGREKIGMLDRHGAVMGSIFSD